MSIDTNITIKDGDVFKQTSYGTHKIGTVIKLGRYEGHTSAHVRWQATRGKRKNGPSRLFDTQADAVNWLVSS